MSSGFCFLHIPSSTSNLGQSQLHAPDLTLVAQAILANELQLGVAITSLDQNLDISRGKLLLSGLRCERTDGPTRMLQRFLLVLIFATRMRDWNGHTSTGDLVGLGVRARRHDCSRCAQSQFIANCRWDVGCKKKSSIQRWGRVGIELVVVLHTEFQSWRAHDDFWAWQFFACGSHPNTTSTPTTLNCAIISPTPHRRQTSPFFAPA